jgi:hypothetical protein
MLAVFHFAKMAAIFESDGDFHECGVFQKERSSSNHATKVQSARVDGIIVAKVLQYVL